jgi:hypothetical protein
MTKKTRLVPFDYERYKAGAKAVCRNKEIKIISITFVKREHFSTNPLLVIYEKPNGYQDFWALLPNGRRHQAHYDIDDCDLFLEEELKEKTFYVNVYPNPHRYYAYKQ